MVTREDIESFLLRAEANAEEIEPGMWVIETEQAKLVLHFSPPVLLLRMKVLALPADESRCTGLFRRLLELNATDLVHGAYGIEEGDVILTDTLELENLGFGEFQSVLDSMQLALASHLEPLSAFLDC